MPTGSLSASAALAAFLEPFIEGRRALVFGSALASTPRLLLERGARVVHVCDPAPLRVAEAEERAAAPGLSFSAFSDEGRILREGGFDCVLVENLGAFDARAVVAKVRRLLAPRGVALFVTTNREVTSPLLPAPEPQAAPIDYYALYDLVSGEFEHVRMLGQAPFVGYTVVDFAPEAAPEPLIDSEFIPRGSEEPELFIALASRHRTALTGYAVVQLPLHRVLSGAAVSQRAALPEQPPVSNVASLELARKLEQQETWIAELEARAETADLRADRAEEELERVQAELASLRARGPERAPRIVAPAVPTPKPVPAPPPPPPPAPDAALVRELETARSELRELEALRAKVRELEALRAKVRELEARVAERDASRATLEGVIAERDARITELSREAPAETTDDFAALERQLVERGHELRRLEQDLAESERVGRELVGELSRAEGSATRELSAKLDTLAERLAASEADRVALRWAAEVRVGQG